MKLSLSAAVLLGALAASAHAGPAFNQAASMTTESSGAAFDGSVSGMSTNAGQKRSGSTFDAASSSESGGFMSKIKELVTSRKFMVTSGLTILGLVVGVALTGGLGGALLGAAAGLGVAFLFLGLTS